MGNSGLLQGCVAADHVTIGEQQAVGHTQHQIQTAKARIGINEQNFFAQSAQGNGNIGTKRGFSRAALARGDGDNSSHGALLSLCRAK